MTKHAVAAMILIMFVMQPAVAGSLVPTVVAERTTFLDGSLYDQTQILTAVTPSDLVTVADFINPRATASGYNQDVMAEFAIGANVSTAVVTLNIQQALNNNSVTPGIPLAIGIEVFGGNGTIALSDFPPIALFGNFPPQPVASAYQQVPTGNYDAPYPVSFDLSSAVGLLQQEGFADMSVYVGVGNNSVDYGPPQASFSFIDPVSVPEPSSIILMLIGVATVATGKRRYSG